jgi:hypothetical protein
MQVRVYRNLNKKCLSIQHKTEKGWRVRGYTDKIFLSNARFIVNESGRKRVIKEKKKNVHAFIEGILEEEFNLPLSTPVYYNPYLYSSFVTHTSKTPVFKCEKVIIEPHMILINSII